MRVIFLLWGAISIIYLDLSGTFADKRCYQAKICIHDGKEKCGRDEKGNVRRFLDSCDIKEYNCLQKAEYVKVDKSECNDLPKIPDSDPKGKAKETKQKHSEEVKQNGDDEEQVTAEEVTAEDQNVTSEKTKRSKDDKKSAKTKSNSKKPNKKSRI